MNRLLTRFEATVQKHEMLQSNDTVIAACSGGPDSVALLEALLFLRDRLKLAVVLAHLNHSLRGEESRGDAVFVHTLALRYNLPIIIGTQDVKKYAAENRLSIEEAARTVRYRFLVKAAKKYKADKIALGHNQDDRIETFIMRLLRGAGPHGLSSIPYIRREQSIVLIRPLLDTPRREIELFLKERNLKYRIDSSNKEEKFLRNRVRLSLLPLLEKEYRHGVKDNILKAMDTVSLYHDFIEKEVEREYKSIITKEGGGVIIDAGKLSLLHPYIQQEIIKKTLYAFDIDVNKKHISALINLSVKLQSGKKIVVGNNLTARKEYDTILITRKESQKEIASKVLDLHGKTYAGNVIITAYLHKTFKHPFKKRAVQPGRLTEPGVCEEYFDYDKLKGGSLFIRSRKSGDTFKPLGFQSYKKVKDIFINEKIPHSLRSSVPLIVTAHDEIIWIVGYRMSDDYKVTGKTQEVLQLTVERKGEQESR